MQRAELNQVINDMAQRSLRALCLAYRDLSASEHPESEDDFERWTIPEGGLTCLAIVGIKDPPRPGVPEAVAKCQAAGVMVRPNALKVGLVSLLRKLWNLFRLRTLAKRRCSCTLISKEESRFQSPDQYPWLEDVMVPFKFIQFKRRRFPGSPSSSQNQVPLEALACSLLTASIPGFFCDWREILSELIKLYQEFIVIFQDFSGR